MFDDDTADSAISIQSVEFLTNAAGFAAWNGGSNLNKLTGTGNHLTATTVAGGPGALMVKVTARDADTVPTEASAILTIPIYSRRE